MRVFVVTHSALGDATYQIGVADSVEAAQWIAEQDYDVNNRIIRWSKWVDENRWGGLTDSPTRYAIQEFALVRSEWR